jgi:hypothetical protein
MNESKFVHFRRCHVCDGVSEMSETHVQKCGDCGKNLAPYYFFDESTVPVYSVDELLPLEERVICKDPSDSSPRRLPLRGVSTFW